jgi:hypothetical protein
MIWPSGGDRWFVIMMSGGCSIQRSPKLVITSTTSGSAQPPLMIFITGGPVLRQWCFRIPAGTRRLRLRRRPPRALTWRPAARPGAIQSCSPTQAYRLALLLSARAVGAGRNGDGVIAHAISADLKAWQLGPPLCAPGAGFGQLEILQNKIIDGRPGLVFTCHPHEMTAERIAKSDEYSAWSPSPGCSDRGTSTCKAVHCRARPIRSAAGAVAGRELGDHRLPQARTEGHRRVRDHRPNPGHPRRRGLSRSPLTPRLNGTYVHVGFRRSA